MSKVKQSGFTLLEVLVASVIFISSIAAVSLAYRGALIASDRANYNIVLSGAIPMILSDVQMRVRADDSGSDRITGSGQTWGVNFEWSADLLAFNAAVAQIDLDRQVVVQPKPRFKLWAVRLVVEYQGFEKTYNYNELSWLNENT